MKNETNESSDALKWIGEHYNQIILTVIALAFIAMAFGLFDIAKQIDRLGSLHNLGGSISVY